MTWTENGMREMLFASFVGDAWDDIVIYVIEPKDLLDYWDEADVFECYCYWGLIKAEFFIAEMELCE